MAMIRVRSYLGGRVADYAMRVAVVLSLGLGLWVTTSQQQTVRCHARYAEATARAVDARTEAAEEDRGAVDRMVSSVVTAKSREDTRAALLGYLDARKRADETRRRNPLPPAPSELCK